MTLNSFLRNHETTSDKSNIVTWNCVGLRVKREFYEDISKAWTAATEIFLSNITNHQKNSSTEVLLRYDWVGEGLHTTSTCGYSCWGLEKVYLINNKSIMLLVKKLETNLLSVSAKGQSSHLLGPSGTAVGRLFAKQWQKTSLKNWTS